METKQWKPNDGPQTDVLTRTEFEIGYGGARGGGKTEAGLAWLLYDSSHPKYRALVIRKHSKDLDDWLDRAVEFYSSLGVERKGRDLYFSTGGVIRTGHLKDDNAYGRYQGHEYCRILIEELTQIASESNYLKLLASCRSTIPELIPQVFTSFNPDGPGFFWVRKRFNIVGIPNKPIETTDPMTGLKRVFIPSKLSDNPFLSHNDSYRAMLNGLPDGLREAWKDGSWNDPVIEGAYYTKELQQARHEGRIKLVPYDPTLKVHTVWDIGVDDSTAILFVQKTATDIRVIDCYDNTDHGLNHYHAHLQKLQDEKGYVYGKHFTPHDSNKKEFGTGQTIIQTAEKMGLVLTKIPIAGINDGIQKVRLMFPRVYINELACEQALNAWLNYRREWDEQLLKFHDRAVHDWSSHYADALRYLASCEDQMTNVDKVKYVPQQETRYQRPGLS